MHGPAILARRWMQLAVGTDQITAGCRGVFTKFKICPKTNHLTLCVSAFAFKNQLIPSVSNK